MQTHCFCKKGVLKKGKIAILKPVAMRLVNCLSLASFPQRKNQLKDAYCNNLWDGARKTLATLWDGHGAIWHGKGQVPSGNGNGNGMLAWISVISQRCETIFCF